MLVVVAIIGTLIALLLPAIQATREAGRRASCANNTRQIGLAANAYLAEQGSFPPAAESHVWAAWSSTPWTFFRWSALAKLTPYLEDKSVSRMLDFGVPLYDGNFNVPQQNVQGVATFVPTFLCPSDRRMAVSRQFAPTNYAVCAGSGNDGGSPITANGIFYVNSHTRPEHIANGLSHTAMASESTLGNASGSGSKGDPNVDYKFTRNPPLTDAICAGAAEWNNSDGRGFAWVSGEFRCALYNHYYLPNQTVPDCIGSSIAGDIDTKFTAYGWRTARSRHPGGVNLLMADGSTTFVSDDIAASVWQAMSMRKQ